MDLCERRNGILRRHPWELARLKALKVLLKRTRMPKSDSNVLDIGCGDGFVCSELFKGLCVKSLTGIDTNFSEQEIPEPPTLRNGITYHNSYDGLRREFYNLILLLDVIEHIEDDETFFTGIIDKYLASGGYVLITVPAFKFLFNSHDRFMRHYRRYNRRGLLRLINSADLKVIASGYLFSSLILPRMVSLWYEKLSAPKYNSQKKGVGVWTRGILITKLVEVLLVADNTFSLLMNNFGVKLPGLTGWALCKKQQS